MYSYHFIVLFYVIFKLQVMSIEDAASIIFNTMIGIGTNIGIFPFFMGLIEINAVKDHQFFVVDTM